MKKITKAILGTTACLLMGASTIGLSGCISSAEIPEDLTNNVDNIVTKADTIIVDTTAIKTSITAIETAIEAINTQLSTPPTSPTGTTLDGNSEDEINAQTTILSNALNDLKTLINSNKASIDTLAPKLDNINTAVSSIATTINNNLNTESAKILNSLTAINTALTTINSKVDSIITAINTQTNTITGSLSAEATNIINGINTQTDELTAILNAQTSAIQSTLAEQTDKLIGKVDELKEQVNQLLNKQDRLTHDEAFELIMYASNKINFSKQNNVIIEMSVKGFVDDGTDDGEYAELLQTTEKVISNTYGEVVRHSYTTESGSVMVAPYDEQLCFKYNNKVYTAYLTNNEIADFYEYPTGFYEQALNIYTTPMSSLFQFSKDDICFTSTNGNNHIIHINKTETIDIMENSVKIGTKDMVYLIKFEIDNDANVISLEQEKKAISSTVANYDLEKDYLKTTSTATPIEENKNLEEIETKMAEIIDYLKTTDLYMYNLFSSQTQFGEAGLTATADDEICETINKETKEYISRQQWAGSVYKDGFVKVVNNGDGTWTRYSKLITNPNNDPTEEYVYTTKILTKQEVEAAMDEEYETIWDQINEITSLSFDEFIEQCEDGDMEYNFVNNNGEYTLSITSPSLTDPIFFTYTEDRIIEFSTPIMSIKENFNQDFFDSFDVSTGFPTPTDE